jgi:3-oxoadipate enol-lactonase
MSAEPLTLAHTVTAPDHEATVLLLHSLALDRHMWGQLAGALSGSRAVVTMDLRGHGESPHDHGFTIEQMADDVALTLSHLGRDQVAVVGLSMGGSVAQALAVRHPDRVTGLGLVDTTAWYGPDAGAAWGERADKARASGMRSLSQFQLDRWFGEEFRSRSPELCSQLLDVFAANDVDSYVASCHALGAMDLREGVASITVPTIIVVGEDDPATPPSHAADLHERISDSQLRVVPGARHLTPLERPDEVLEQLRKILG